MKNFININEVINTKLKGRVNKESINDLKVWLNTDRKIKSFEQYVENMGNNCLELDVVAYRQLVLDNREMDLEGVKKRLKQAMGQEDFISIHIKLRNLLLEDLKIEQVREFIKRSKDMQFVELFINYWNDRKGLPFDKLLKSYLRIVGVAA
ncbi:hypothetical protein [Clostridium sp. KNHs214]|uniref:hypothetical protein n=1 Tax=Clostridium sp. KNHs214 TaxID=1540257 RepID=UPI0005587CDF|nr:hypothetical protein [Clostridium sp. KNHs214]